MKKIIFISLVSALCCVAVAQNQRTSRGTTNNSGSRTTTSQSTPQRTDRRPSTSRPTETKKPSTNRPSDNRRPTYSGGNNRTPVYSGGNNRTPVYSGGNTQNYRRNPHIDVNTRRHYGQYHNRLPRGGSYYRYGGHSYYYCDGHYYRPYNNRYVICRPPAGAVVAASIFSAALTAITVQAINSHTMNTYYYNDGTYYTKDDGNQYRAVTPPIGARISALPYGCEELVLDGKYYYKVDDTYYKPIPNPYTGKEEYEVVGQSLN